MAALSFVLRTFDWGGGKWPSLERKVQGLGKIFHQKVFKKKLISKQTQSSKHPGFDPDL